MGETDNNPAQCDKFQEDDWWGLRTPTLWYAHPWVVSSQAGQELVCVAKRIWKRDGMSVLILGYKRLYSFSLGGSLFLILCFEKSWLPHHEHPLQRGPSHQPCVWTWKEIFQPVKTWGGCHNGQHFGSNFMSAFEPESCSEAVPGYLTLRNCMR